MMTRPSIEWQWLEEMGFRKIPDRSNDSIAVYERTGHSDSVIETVSIIAPIHDYILDYQRTDPRIAEPYRLAGRFRLDKTPEDSEAKEIQRRILYRNL